MAAYPDLVCLKRKHLVSNSLSVHFSETCSRPDVDRGVQPLDDCRFGVEVGEQVSRAVLGEIVLNLYRRLLFFWVNGVIPEEH